MAVPSRDYNDAVNKGRTLFADLQRRLSIPASHDVETPSLDLQSDMKSALEWPGQLKESEDTFKNEGLILKEGAWTTETIFSRPGSVRLYLNLFKPYPLLQRV